MVLLKEEQKIRVLMEDPQDLSLPVGALGLWEDSNAAANQ